MSDASSKQLWKSILDGLDAHLAKNTEALRDEIQRRIGQIYIFDKEALTKAVNEVLTGAIKNYKDLSITVTEQTALKTLLENKNFNAGEGYFVESIFASFGVEQQGIQKMTFTDVTAAGSVSFLAEGTFDKVRNKVIQDAKVENPSKQEIQTEVHEKLKLNNWEDVLNNCIKLAERYETEAWQSFTASQQQNIGKHNLNERKAYILNIIKGGGDRRLPLEIGVQTAYCFKHHRTAQKYQREIVTKFIAPFVKKTIDELFKGAKSDNLLIKQKMLKAIDKGLLNVGHGASIGASVVASQVAGGFKQGLAQIEEKNQLLSGLSIGLGDMLEQGKKFEANLRNEYEKALRNYASVGSTTQGVGVSVEQEYFIYMVENFLLNNQGRFNGEYISVLSLQSIWGNNVDSNDEKEIKEIIRKNVIPKLQQLVEASGSLSLLQAFERVLFYSVVGKNQKKFKVSGKTLKEFKRNNSWSINYGASYRANSGKTQKGKKLSVKIPTVLPAKSPRKTTKVNKVAPTKMEAGPLQVLGYINQRLAQVVEKNMIPPALESRTGRFARSVRALNMVSTKQGFPSIEYTYDRDPYQVFEMGIGRIPWATPDRDPRKLIDRSIREIAAEMLKGRLFTRRV